MSADARAEQSAKRVVSKCGLMSLASAVFSPKSMRFDVIPREPRLRLITLLLYGGSIFGVCFD